MLEISSPGQSVRSWISMPFGDNRENFRVVIEERSPVEVGKKPCMYVCLAYPLRCFYLVDPGGRDLAG